MDNKTTNKDEAKGSKTLNHELMIKHVIALFRDTMPFNQLLGLEFVTEGEGLDTQISLHRWFSFNCRNHQTNRT